MEVTTRPVTDDGDEDLDIDLRAPKS